MTEAFRTPSGGRVDRGRSLRFTFDRRELTGCAGDSLASALIANGVRLVGRSFRLHRPRGILAAGSEEPNALVTVGVGAHAEPNRKATEVELYDGLVAASQNCWPRLTFDIGAIADLAARFLPAGFYYKTFIWPHWHLYEGAVRRAAGLGRAPSLPDPAGYETRYAHCEVLVVGAGPTGLAAARAALTKGDRVIIADEQRELGGSLLCGGAEGGSRLEALLKALAEAERGGRLTRLPRTTAIGYYDHNLVALLERVTEHLDPVAAKGQPRQRLWLVRAARVILATGVIEQPLMFPGNDRPGIMLAAAASTYVNRYGVLPGRCALIVTSDDGAYATARDLVSAGARVGAIVDTRPQAPGALADEMAKLGIEVLAGGRIADTFGRAAIRGASVAAPGAARRMVACDLLAMSGGFEPNLHLLRQSGAALAIGAAAAGADRSRPQARAAGAAAGIADTRDCIADGEAAGAEAIASLVSGAAYRSRQSPTGAAPSDRRAWPVERAALRQVFVDLQNDVTVADIEMAARENYVSVEHVKRYTTLGMAVDQGKTANANGVAVLAAASGRGLAEVGMTRARPPYVPVTLGAFAGRERGELFHPRRLLPTHDRQIALGAMLEDYGGWERPVCYPKPRESEPEAVRREMLAVRQGVGLFDGSSLGKIEVAGPDAATFVARIYANAMSTLSVGRLRYGLMLSEGGIVVDDGVAARLGPERFLLGTTSAGAERVLRWLEEWRQCEWPELRVVIAGRTTAFATLALAGPRTRDVLEAAGCDLDLRPEAFAHMSVREGKVAGIAARLARVSFTGEMSYEISVPWTMGEALFDKLLAAGEPFAITPIGVEAWLALRVEKGYVHLGSDTDGTTIPDDIGFGPAVAKRRDDFIGARSLALPYHRRAPRLQLVGVTPCETGEALTVGAHLVASSSASSTTRKSEGYVTSACDSPTLGRWVGLGLLADGRARHGEVVEADDCGRRVRVRIVEPCSYDREGRRLHG